MARDSGDVSMWRRSAARASAAPLPPPESSAGVEFPCSHSSSLRPHHLRLASRYLASLRKLLQHVSAIKQESRIMLLPGRPIAWLSRPACGSAKPALTAPRPQPRPPPWRPLVPPRTDVGCDRADAPRLRHPRPDAPVLRAAYANRDMRSLRPAKHSTKCARTPHGQLGCAPLRSRCRHGSRHHRRSATTPRPQVKNVSSDAGSHTLYALPSAAQVQHQPGKRSPSAAFQRAVSAANFASAARTSGRSLSRSAGMRVGVQSGTASDARVGEAAGAPGVCPTSTSSACVASRTPQFLLHAQCDDAGAGTLDVEAGSLSGLELPLHQQDESFCGCQRRG